MVVKWIVGGPNGPAVPHPSPCDCGCYCGLGCRCNGKSCDCEVCDVYEKHGLMDFTDHQKERLPLCDCKLCQKTRPESRKRFARFVK